MKVFHTDFERIYLIYLPMMGVLTLVYYFGVPQFLTGLAIHWLFLPVLLVALVHRNSTTKIKLYQPPPRSALRWLLEMFSFQTALMMIFIGMAHFFTVKPTLVFRQALLGWGLFPFGLFTLFAGAVAWVITRNQKGLMSTTLTPTFGNEYKDNIGATMDSYARSADLICISLTITTLMFLGMYAINQTIDFTFTRGFHVASVTCMGFLVVFSSSKTYRQIIRPMIKHLPYVLVIILVCVACLLVVYVVYLFTILAIPHSPLEVQLFKNWPAQDYVQLLLYSFMLSWGMAYAGYLVHISQGYRIRSMMLASLVIPSVFAAAFYFFEPGEEFHQLLPWLSAISCLYILVLFVRQRHLTHLNRTALPSEVDLKPRPPYNYMGSLLTFALCFIAVYLTTGPFMMAYVSFVMIVPVGILMALGVRALFE